MTTNTENKNRTRRLSNGRKEVNPEQMIRLDGLNVFVEVMSSAFTIKKVMFNFCKYESGKGITDNETLYMDIPKTLRLCQDILSGRIAKLGQEAKAKQVAQGSKYCGAVFMDQGGISAENLAKQGKSRPDGKCLSRVLKLTPGDRQPWIFQSESGPGELTEKKLITQIGSKIEKRINVPMTEENLKEFALVVMKKIEAFYVAQQQQIEELNYVAKQLETKDEIIKNMLQLKKEEKLTSDAFLVTYTILKNEKTELEARVVYLRKQLGME